jgi:hypothetical protein
MGKHMQGFKEYSQEFDAEFELTELTQEELVQLDEVLDSRARLKRAQQFRRSKTKVALGRKRAAKRLASSDKIKKRALARARGRIIKRMTQGRGKAALSYGARAQLDKRLARMKGGIARLAVKLIRQVKQDDIQKLRGKPSKGGSQKRLVKSTSPAAL